MELYLFYTPSFSPFPAHQLSFLLHTQDLVRQSTKCFLFIYSGMDWRSQRRNNRNTRLGNSVKLNLCASHCPVLGLHCTNIYTALIQKRLLFPSEQQQNFITLQNKGEFHFSYCTEPLEGQIQGDSKGVPPCWLFDFHLLHIKHLIPGTDLMSIPKHSLHIHRNEKCFK